MVITDRYDHVIDEKNRLSIPSQIRNAMDPQVDGSGFYLVPGGDCLQLIPEKAFQRMAAQNRAGIAPNSGIAKARRFIFANASPLMPDKQGRVIIPDRFMADSKSRDPIVGEAALTREVSLIGSNDRVELWSRQRLVEHMQSLAGDVEVRKTVDDLFSEAPKMEGATGPAVQMPGSQN